MNASLLQSDSLAEQVQSLLAAVDRLQAEVGDLRRENGELRRQVSELRCEVGYWKSRHADAVKRNTKLQAELDQAQAEIRQLKAERFGKQSEKQSTTDRSNELVDPKAPVAPPKKKRGQQPGRPAPGRRDYSHLPVREDVVDLPDEVKVCACCGLPLESIGHGDDHEQIEIETTVYRRVIRRKRYRRTCECRTQPRTTTAPLPPKLLRKCLLGTSIWTHLLLEKFHLQRPTHRTIEQLRLFAGKDSVVFVLDPSRSHDIPQAHFPEDAQGVLMVDRYSGYKAMRQVKHGKLVLAFCWAHVRRDFVRVGKGYQELTPWALAWLGRIRELYRLNRERLRHAPGTPEFTAADALLRAQIDAIATQRDAELADDKLREPCRKALESLQEHWSGLTLFVDDPRIPMDNNYGERLIRNPAVGRKNYYGSGAEWSGRLAMIMFTIFATLVLWKINPREWLSWYFEACAANNGKAPDNPAEFLPWNLSAARLTELRSPASVGGSNTS